MLKIMAHHRKRMMSFEELDLETQVLEKGVVKWISDDTKRSFQCWSGRPEGGAARWLTGVMSGLKYENKL